MAELVLGLGVSHTPQMNMSSDHWAEYAARDATAFPLIWKRKRWDYQDLVAARAAEGVAEQVNEEVWAAKYERINDGVARLAAALAEARPDVVVIVGDDHHELFAKESMPTIAVYWGETIDAFPPEWIFPAVEPAAWALFGERPETYPCHADLGRFLITDLNRNGFDVAQVNAAPEGQSAGHPFIAIRNRLMDREQDPIPMVPVVLNTYFPPNTPTPVRCWELGKALAASIAAYPEDIRVAVVASGGLSHFVIDESIDRPMLEALASGDDRRIAAIEVEDYVSGTSEGLCWIAVGGACRGLDMDLVAYVPGYRTEAGTGTAMCAAIWS